MVWKFEKFKGSMSIYSLCPKCGFCHDVSKLNPETMEIEIKYQYNYCPMCGVYLYDDRANTGGVDVTWNERHIEVLLTEGK